MKIKRLITVALFLLAGCIIQPMRLAKTASGFPEVVININDFDRVKHEVITEMQIIGFSLEDDPENHMCFKKELVYTGSSQQENFLKKAEVIYSLSQIQKGIRVILISSVICTYDSHGTILKREEMKDNNVWFNYFYTILQNVKTNVESS